MLLSAVAPYNFYLHLANFLAQSTFKEYNIQDLMVELKECELKIKGMDCPSCAMNVENAVKNLDGIAEINVSFIT